MTSSDALRSSIHDAVDEDATYQTRVLGAPTLPAMMTEVDTHRTHMTMILGDMGTHMSSMMHCGGMMTLRDDMGTELALHAATMHDEAAMDPARVEVGRHVDAMDSMLAGMGSMMDGGHCAD